MTAYVIRRLLLIIPSMLIVSVIIFSIFRLLPGDAALIQVTEGGTSSMSVVQYERALEEMGLDRPALEQYTDWIWGLLHGDGGNSLKTGQPVFNELARAIPVTLELAILALLMSLVISLPIGIMSAVKQDEFWDYGGRLFTVAGLAMPSFLAGSMLLMIMSVYFHWMPPLEYTPFLEDPAKNLAHIFWPALILAYHESAILVRMTRSSMLEVLRKDYIRTAYAKGLAPRTLVVRHALRNALLPVATIAGLQLANLLAGSVIAETIFVLPGVGSALLNGIGNRDWIMVQTIVFLIAATVLLLSLVLDLAYGFLDPRIRLSSMKARSG
jgi:peptide/nickel transport system permease protein